MEAGDSEPRRAECVKAPDAVGADSPSASMRPWADSSQPYTASCGLQEKQPCTCPGGPQARAHELELHLHEVLCPPRVSPFFSLEVDYKRELCPLVLDFEFYVTRAGTCAESPISVSRLQSRVSSV